MLVDKMQHNVKNEGAVQIDGDSRKNQNASGNDRTVNCRQKCLYECMLFSRKITISETSQELHL